MRLALIALMLLPSIGAAQDFRSVVLSETKKARQAGTITFRQALSIRFAMRSPAKAAKIQSEIVSDLWLGGEIPDAFNANGTYNVAGIDWQNIDWEKLLRTILEIIELINRLFAGDGVPDDPVIEDPNPFQPGLSDSAKAADKFASDIRSRLGANFQTVRNNMETRPFSKAAVNTGLNRAMTSAWETSKADFGLYSAAKFENATEADIKNGIDEFIEGFNGR